MAQAFSSASVLHKNDRVPHPFLKQLRFVDTALSDGRQYLMGDRFTAADILLMTCLTWSISYKVGVCDSARPYMDRIAARPAYQAALVANKLPAAKG